MVKLFSCTSCVGEMTNLKNQLYNPYILPTLEKSVSYAHHRSNTYAESDRPEKYRYVHASRPYDMPMRVAMGCDGVCVGVVSPIVM